MFSGFAGLEEFSFFKELNVISMTIGSMSELKCG